MTDNFCYFYFIFLHSWFLSHSISSSATIKSGQPELLIFADSLSDWLVVSLPYSGVCCVYAGRGIYQINRMNSPKVEQVAHIASSTKLVLGPNKESFRLFTGGLSYQTSLIWLTVPSEAHLLCSDLLCMHTVHVSFCLDWFWKKKSIFCICSLMCHNSCFLAHC